MASTRELLDSLERQKAWDAQRNAAHEFLVILYYPDRVTSHRVPADCYADAVLIVAPGNDLVKIEAIAL